MKPLSFRPTKNAGLSLLEVLVVVAGIAIIASVGTVSIGNVKSRVENQKLVQDVETINRAIQVYEGNGGDTSILFPHPWWIQGMLKSQATNVDTSIGLTGTLIDSELDSELMTPSEAGSSSAPRAAFDATKMRFVVITDTSIPSIAYAKRFTWNEGGGNALEDIAINFFTNFRKRENAFDYASTGKWVWDYSDSTAAAGPAPTSVPLNPGLPTTPPGGPGGPPVLDPPTFSLPGGNHPLAAFPLALELVNPNDPAVSAVYFWTSLTGWQEYSGAIPVMPGTAVTAFAKSTDTAFWRDSGFAEGNYDAIPLTLEVAVTAPGSVNWGEAGGGIQPGGPAPTLASPGEITIANEASIPDTFESSANFMVYWTTDGSDPLSSATRNGVSSFTGGFPGQSLGVSLADFGADTSLQFRSAAESLNADYFNTSAVTDRTVAINVTNLRNPMILDAAAIVTINQDTSFGDMPVGARVYYTLDGTDPGDAGGEPVTGTEYTGPFSVKGLGSPIIPVRARVYGTDGYEHWFNSSSTISSTVLVPPAVMGFSHSASMSAPGL